MIESFKVDRLRSTNNVENRKLSSDEHGYYLYYSFCSRIWNRSMEELLPMVKQFDLVFIQSIIWDLSKYSDLNGKNYLENLDICLGNLIQLNKNVVWIFLPPPDSHRLLALNNRISNMYTPVTDIVKHHGCQLLDLYQIFKNYSICIILMVYILIQMDIE